MQTGESIPDILLRDLDGLPHLLDEWRGVLVVLNFWSAECPWSERVDRDLEERKKTWGDAVVILTIAANACEQDKTCSQRATQRGLPFVFRVDAHAMDLLGAQTTPHVFLVDREGVLRYQGAYDDVSFRQRQPLHSYLQDAVEALLAGKAPDPAETSPCGCTIIREISC